LKKRKILAQNHSGAKRPKQGPYDLWGQSVNVRALSSGVEREWVEAAIPKQVLPPKWPVEMTSALPAVEIEAGDSYHPTYEAHQDQLATAVAAELKKQEKEKKWNRMLRGERKNAPRLENVPEVDNLDESGCAEEENPAGRESPDGQMKKTHNPYSTKLTQTQRNRMMRRQAQERERAKKLELKAQRRKFEKLPQLIKELNEKELLDMKQQEEKTKRKVESQRVKTKKLGPHRFDEGPKPVLLSAELPNNLRSLQPPVSLFTERFKSLQKRNLLEPRKKVTQKRKYKKKTFEKRTSKMEWEL